MASGAGALAQLGAVSNTEGWRQLGELGLAFVLSSLIGVEREIREKSAGLRTHSLVGVGAAVFMLISKYGFADVLEPGRVVLDPSRVAAQIVTGIGFLGAGLIFVRHDSVRGLTTAAAVWLTAAIGAAAGADLPVLACVATALYLIVTVGLTTVSHRLSRGSRAGSTIRVRYHEGVGSLRGILTEVTRRGFVIDDLSAGPVGGGGDRAGSSGSGDSGGDRAGSSGSGDSGATVEVAMSLRGRASVTDLTAALAEVDGVEAVAASASDGAGDLDH